MLNSREQGTKASAMLARLPRVLTTWDRRWEHWYQRILPVYVVTLFCTTHLPNLRLEGNLAPNDHLMHFVAFGILAFLFWRFFEALRLPLNGSFVVVAAIALVTYASFDEYTQRFVNRGVEWADWFCNISGIGVVLTLLEITRRMRRTPQHA